MFSHPLGLLPWSISNPGGPMKKTMKAMLGKHLEILVSPTVGKICSSTTVIDGMALIQKSHGEIRKFYELHNAVTQFLNTTYYSTRIDVFETYRDKSKESAERRSLGSDTGIHFKNIKRGHRMIKWRCLLQTGDSKNIFLMFLPDSWQEERKRTKNGKKTLYVTCSKSVLE